eukprot:scaffold6882_cov21-Tisochrysis_lutea.AAC.8
MAALATLCALPEQPAQQKQVCYAPAGGQGLWYGSARVLQVNAVVARSREHSIVSRHGVPSQQVAQSSTCVKCTMQPAQEQEVPVQAPPVPMDIPGMRHCLQQPAASETT